jgi:hypothetical protein
METPVIRDGDSSMSSRTEAAERYREKAQALAQWHRLGRPPAAGDAPTPLDPGAADLPSAARTRTFEQGA